MKKIVSIIALVIVMLFAVACANPNHNRVLTAEELLVSAQLFDRAENFAKENYLKQNKTHYPSNKDGLPEERYQIINSNKKLARAFEPFPQEVDFAQEFLVVYFFTDHNYGYGCQLDTITKNGDEITIEVVHGLGELDENGHPPMTGSAPTQRCLVVKLPNCYYKTVNVNITYAYTDI